MYGPWVRVPASSQKGCFKQPFFIIAFLYILYSEKLKKYYIGACTDLERRIYEHNIGHSKFTSLGMPWILKYKEEFESLQLAKKRELEIKRKKSRRFIEFLIGQQGS